MTSVPLSSHSCGAKMNDVEAIGNSSADEPPDDARNTVSMTVKFGPSTTSVVDEFSNIGLQAKKSSFMITRVVAKSEGDSTDDIDDVTNTEEISSVADASHNRWSSAETVHSPCEFSPRSPGFVGAVTQNSIADSQLCHVPAEVATVEEVNDVQSRFRIVKLESRTPFVRGRWTCMDFSDPPSTAQTNGLSDSHDIGSDADNPAQPPIYFVDNLLGAAFTPAFVYSSDGLPVLERNPLKSITDGNIYSPVISADQSSNRPASLPRNTVAVEADKVNSVDHVLEVDAQRRQSDLSLLSNAGNVLILPDGSNNSDGLAGTFAIDNKIEQAMDLVKSHLMFAVHEEVEVLKEQIKELTMKNAQLEFENSVLRSAAPPDVLAKLDATPATPAPSAAPNIAGQPSSGALS